MNGDVSDGKRIAAAVMAWAGVERAPHRFGGIEFRLGSRELSHLHGDPLVDLPFPRWVRDELVAAGRARPGRRRERDRALRVSRTTARSRHASEPRRNERMDDHRQGRLGQT
jgi:Family of unknown function (DUF5519)